MKKLGTRPIPAAAVAAGLAILVVAVFAPVRHFAFVSWDDTGYVTRNAHVLAGLTWQNVAWALSTGEGYYWHPLTWLSHMLDVQVFGLDAGAHHLTSLVLHLVSTLLLFGVLARMTRRTGPSALVAALFAVHPLHVESVAWVAERKDVLSGLCWMLTLWAYTWYAETPSPRRYALVTLAFLLALASKPTVVTLPVVLLLLDWWPLGRFPGAGGRVDRPTRSARQLVLEKLPWLGLAAACSLLTFFNQGEAGAVRGIAAYPVGLRIENALVSAALYLSRTVWPSGLAAFYPYRRSIPAWQLAASAAALGAATTIVLGLRRTRPYLLVGWAWFIVGLLPVIGLVQAGDQSLADRFTYLPLIGLFVAVAWLSADVVAAAKVPRPAAVSAALVLVAALAVLSRAQLGYWRDSGSLWERDLAVTSNNDRAQVNLALLDVQDGRIDQAVDHYREASRILEQDARSAGIAPAGAANVQNEIGLLLTQQGRPQEAIRAFSSALRLQPRQANARRNLAATYNNLGTAAAGREDRAEAETDYRHALGYEPDYALARNNLAGVLLEQGRAQEALAEAREAVRLAPGEAGFHYTLGAILEAVGDHEGSQREMQEAARLDPSFAPR